MAIPPLEFSLACTGITGSVRDQTLRGEASASVATRTFSGAGAEADATSLPPPESVTVPGALRGTRKAKIYDLLTSDVVCQKIYEQFQIDRAHVGGVTSILSLIARELGYNISQVECSALLTAGRKSLRGEEKKNTYYVDVAQKIIAKAGEDRPVKVVPAKTLLVILEQSPKAMRAIKAGIENGEFNTKILQRVEAILEAEDAPQIPKSYFFHFVRTVRQVLKSQNFEITNFTDPRYKSLYPLAQKIAQIPDETTEVSQRAEDSRLHSARSLSELFERGDRLGTLTSNGGPCASGAGAGTVLPSCPLRPVSLTARETTEVSQRREDPRLDASGAGVQDISLPPPESGTVPGAAESTKPKIYRLLDFKEICVQIFAQFKVTRSFPHTLQSIQVLVIEKLKHKISRTSLCRLVVAGRKILRGEEQENSCYVDVAQQIIDKVSEGRSVKVVPTKLSEILEGSQNAMLAVKAGVEERKKRPEILDTVKGLLKEEDVHSIPEKAFFICVSAVKAVLRDDAAEILRKLKNKDFRAFYTLAQKIAAMDTSSAPKRARETRPVLSEAGARAGAGGENISSQASDSRGTQEESGPKRARTTSPDWAGIPDFPPSQSQRVPDETRTGDSQSAEDSRRDTAGAPSGLCDGDGHRPEGLTSMGGPCASGAGAELFGAEDAANDGDLLGLLGDNDFADSFSIEDSSPSAGQEEN